MAEAIGQFSITNTPESELFTFDFANDLRPGDSIASVTSWTCGVAVGTDAGAAGRVSGSPTLFGSRVTQRGGGFLPGVTYVMTALVHTALGDDLDLWAYLPCGVIGC